MLLAGALHGTREDALRFYRPPSGWWLERDQGPRALQRSGASSARRSIGRKPESGLSYANFRERRKSEVQLRRILPPRSSVYSRYIRSSEVISSSLRAAATKAALAGSTRVSHSARGTLSGSPSSRNATV